MTQVAYKKKAILYSSEEWSKLLSYLSEKQKLEENVETKRREVQDRKEMSKHLKDSFVDSKKEQRLKLQLEREKANYEKELQKIEEEKKKDNLKIIEQTRLALKRNKDGWKALDSALRLADTLRERKKQQEFQDQVKTHERELDKDWNEKVLQNALEFQEQQQRERQEKIIRKNESFERTSQSLKELQKERDQLRQLQIQEELKEIDKVKQEIKDIEDKEKVNKENTKRIINEMTRESFLLERRKRKKEKEEEELDKATFHIIKQTTGQLTDMKNQIVQQKHEAEVARREKIYQHVDSLMKADEDNEDNEEEKIRRVLAEEEDKQNAKLKLEDEKRRQVARDKIEGYQQYLREVEETERENKEKIKWETLKRFKMTEHDKAREEEMKAMEMRKKENQRRNLDTQMEELKLYATEIREADQEALKRSALLWQLDDAEVMKYGEQVLQECENKERPTLPVVKAITTYKRNNRLVPPQSKNLSQFESNVLPRSFPIKFQQLNRM